LSHELVVRIASRLPAVVAAGDLLAGVTVWAVLVPEALAYASIAGVSPVVRHASDNPRLARVYPTVQAAVDAAQRSSH
jgi:hypothetical protein